MHISYVCIHTHTHAHTHAHTHKRSLQPLWQPFHAYEAGNLNWEAAFEVEAATLAITLRYWPNEVGPIRASSGFCDRIRGRVHAEPA